MKLQIWDHVLSIVLIQRHVIIVQHWCHHRSYSLPHRPFNNRSNDSSVYIVPKLQAAKTEELFDSWYKKKNFLLYKAHPVSCPVDMKTLTGLHFCFQGFIATVRLKVKHWFHVTVSLLLLPGAELPSWKFWPSQRPLSISLDPGRRLSSFRSSFGKCPV